MHIDQDFEGNVLQALYTDRTNLQGMTLNITASGNSSIAVFGWTGEGFGPAFSFLSSFLRQKEHGLADAIMRLAFEYLENLFVSPEWWNGLDKELQDEIESRMASGSNDEPRRTNCLADNGSKYFQSVPTVSGIIL